MKLIKMTKTVSHLRNPLTFALLLSDVRACNEAKKVPLYWELLICSQSGGEGRLDVHEEQQL